ncbi:MAG: hypothetical protein IJ285_06800 [Clostridia bacterium]|nr:hypothetical protein [Clostridia bacterium]
MKKIISILLLVAVFATMLSMTAFAAGANTFTITTDKTSVTAGEKVVVTVTATGDFLAVANVSTSVVFDTDKFDIDADTTDWSDDLDSEYNVCLDMDWLDSVHNDKKNSLGRLAAPPSVVGENPAGQLNVVFQKSSGLTASNSNLVANGSVVTLKAIFTALVDVETIDATCFSLPEGICKITDENKVSHTISLVQLEAAGPAPFVPETKKGDAIACDNTITFEKEGFLNDYYSNVAVAKATLGADVPYSEAGFIWATVDGEDTVTETANKFVATDDDAVSGEGTFAYGVVMYGVPEGVTLKAIPYYVTADPNAAE